MSSHSAPAPGRAGKNPDAALQELAGQHGGLAAHLERFMSLALHTCQHDEARNCLRDLLLEVSAHFGYEESVMLDFAYPEYDAHLRQHVAMTTELALLLDRMDEGGGFDAVRNIAFLQEWYRRHAEYSDDRLLSWLSALDYRPDSHNTGNAATNA